jgi:hypothetical protein
MQQITVFIDLQDQLSMFQTNIFPKHVELILKINKHCYLLHLLDLDFIKLPTLKMPDGQTQIKCNTAALQCLNTGDSSLASNIFTNSASLSSDSAYSFL